MIFEQRFDGDEGMRYESLWRKRVPLPPKDTKGQRPQGRGVPTMSEE